MRFSWKYVKKCKNMLPHQNIPQTVSSSASCYLAIFQHIANWMSSERAYSHQLTRALDLILKGGLYEGQACTFSIKPPCFLIWSHLIRCCHLMLLKQQNETLTHANWLKGSHHHSFMILAVTSWHLPMVRPIYMNTTLLTSTASHGLGHVEPSA